MTAPTMADHRRDAVRYPACNCGAVWRQRGNRTGHCTRCHETFHGIDLFDRHFIIRPDGSATCRNPHDQWSDKAPRLELIDGVWYGPRMDAATIAARFGTDTPSAPRQTPENGPQAPAPDPAHENAADGRTAR